MKICSCRKNGVRLLLTLLCLGISVMGFSRRTPIHELRLIPRAPLPGQQLRLYISLSPLAEHKETEVSIRLITYRDLDGDWRYAEDGEIKEHPLVFAKDNQGQDEEPLTNEIRVPVYTVPKTHPPKKYVAIVEVGKNSAKKSTSLHVPGEAQPITGGSDGLWGVIKKVVGIPSQLARKLTYDRTLRAPENGYFGANTLCLVSLEDEAPVLDKISPDSEDLYLSPSWSFDSQKIAFVLNRSSERKIGWMDIHTRHLFELTTGPDDRAPFWLPDGKHILFFRDQRLHAINIESQQIQVIDEELRVSQILGVTRETENRVAVIYTAPNPYTAETKDVYLLELDGELKQKRVTQLVYTPAWFVQNAISPSGSQLVYSDAGSLVISSTSGTERKRLFEGQFKYYEPSWSPDGKKIVCVSSRP